MRGSLLRCFVAPIRARKVGAHEIAEHYTSTKAFDLLLWHCLLIHVEGSPASACIDFYEDARSYVAIKVQKNLNAVSKETLLLCKRAGYALSYTAAGRK